MRIGNRTFDTANHTYVMGILNVTPDSFSDGGSYNRLDLALKHVEEMMAQGADIIDVGGESTRPGYTLPGYTQLSDEEEIDRVVTMIEAVKANLYITISQENYKSKVAEANLAAGAHLLNDIWGLKADDKMAGVIAKYDAACCLMHNRNEADYKNFMEDMKNDLRETLRLAKEAGIREDGIMTDPGVGFGKTYENNLEAIRCVGELNELGYPVLLGTSRKSVIGLTLDVPAKERDTATAVTSAYAVWAHCGFVRVHNVRANAEAIKMAEAIRDGGLHG